MRPGIWGVRSNLRSDQNQNILDYNPIIPNYSDKGSGIWGDRLMINFQNPLPAVVQSPVWQRQCLQCPCSPYLNKVNHDVVVMVGALYLDQLDVPDPRHPHEHSLQPQFVITVDDFLHFYLKPEITSDTKSSANEKLQCSASLKLSEKTGRTGSCVAIKSQIYISNIFKISDFKSIWNVQHSKSFWNV